MTENCIDQNPCTKISDLQLVEYEHNTLVL